MGDQLGLDEPSAKKAKIGSNDGFDEWKFMGGADDLPDELLETAPSTSNAVNQNVTAPSHSSTFSGIPNGLTAPNAPPVQFGTGMNNFSPMQQNSVGGHVQQHHPPAHFAPNGVNIPTSSGPSTGPMSNSVLEELLLTNRTPSSAAPPSGQGMYRPPSSIATASMGMQNSIPNRSMVTVPSAPLNRLGSPPNVQVMNRQMPVYSTSEPYPSGGGNLSMISGNGGMPPQYHRPPMQQDQMMMMAGAGGRPPMMNGQNRNPGGNQNFFRVQRPPTSASAMMMSNGPMVGPPNQQQMLPMNVIQQQQQMAQAHHAARMNGPTPINTHGGHQPFMQDFHPSQMQQQPSFSSMPGQQMGHQPNQMMTGGVRSRMPHPDMNVGPQRTISDPFSPSMGMQPGDRLMGPASVRGQFPPSNPNMMNNANPPLDMLNSSLSNGMPMPPSIQAPSSTASLPYPSPSMLMSPSGGGGPGNVQAASNDPIGGVGHPTGAPQDPEKRKLIQQQLVLLLHALKCQQRERTSEQSACSLPHCGTMKNVLTHMTTCQEGRSCTIPHCASSRQILAHWRSCTREDCPVCSPLRQMTDRGGRANGNPGAPPTMNGHPMDSALANESQIVAKLSMPDTPLGRNLEAEMESFRPSLRTSHLLSQDSNDGSTSSFTPKLPAPEVASVQREWHRQVTLDLRNHLVSKLVKAIFPSPDPAAMHDQRIRDLIQYARKVEKEMFETANDREEYYHLLAEKIYKIQKELQEKKQRRLEQSQGQGPGDADSGLSVGFDIPSAPNRTDSSHRAPVTVAALASQLTAGTLGGQASLINGAGLPQGGHNVKLEDNGGTLCRAGTSSTAAAPKFETTIKTEPMESVNDDVKPSTSGDAAADSKSVVKATKKVFSVEDLKSALLPVWERLEQTEDAIPFREPVDPNLLGIPDYFDIIKNPMDLYTIKEKLINGEYSDPWQFCDDMWLMFENAWLYNRKNSKVYKYCTKLSENFVDDIDPVMRSLGYCCGRKLAFTPLALVCYGQPMCAIPRDAIYYCYEDNKSQFGVSSERYTYCRKCFEELPGESINMSDDPSSDNVIPKKNFKQLKNDQIEYEPFFDCVECGRKWHQICALHMDQIFPGGFVCESCLKGRIKKRPENRYTSKRLPQCKLSQHLEKRVNDFLKTKLSPDTPAGEVVIRVLSSSDKEVDIKAHMKAKFCATGQFPEKFPYKSKAIFAFEVIDGVEVCFFGLHVQEFGSNCPNPNQRRVYIAYLDSVHFFMPRIVRTQVYHEILLGYLDYVKKMGYTMAHIWACPPSEGDDYIFHCHPPEQKIPKPKRLQEWYKKLLDRGIIERTVTDYKDIYEFYLKEEPLTSVTELPFFEGDYWPNVVEECIREVDNEEAERRREAEAQAAAGVAPDDLEDDADEIFGQGKKRNAKDKKNKSKSKSTNYKKSKKGGGGTGNDLTDKIMTALEKHKEVFFVVRLYSKQSASALPTISDPDPHISCDFMDGRDTFLSTARDRHWEFSSLRRAKYSTMALCYELHMQGSDKFVYTCNSCKNNGVWHCAICEDFDLCQECYAKTQHEHKMDRIIIDSGDSAAVGADGAAGANPRDRNESIQRCIQTLVHASQCRDANCRRPSCQKMKRVVQHVKGCKNWQSGSGSNTCSVCRQLLTLCVYHARHCQENNCFVPLCQNIRQKLAERQAQLRRKREREMMRRINLMSNQNSIAAAGAGPSTPYQQTASPVPSMNVAPAPPMMGSMGYQQPAVNPAAVRAARDIEKIAQQQVQFGGTVMTQPYQRPPMTPVRPQAPMTAMSAMVGGAGPSQMVPLQQQPSWDGGGGGGKPRSFQGQYPNAMPPAAGPNFAGGNSRTMNEHVANIVHRLKTAGSQEEREAILKSLQGEPALFAAIIKVTRQGQSQRQQQLQQQQQQQPPPQQQQMWNGPNQQPMPPQGPPPQPYFAPRHVMNNAQPTPPYGRLQAPPGAMYGQPRGPMQQALSPQMAPMGGQGPANMQQQQHFMQHQQIMEPGSNSAEQNKFL